MDIWYTSKVIYNDGTEFIIDKYSKVIVCANGFMYYLSSEEDKSPLVWINIHNINRVIINVL